MPCAVIVMESQNHSGGWFKWPLSKQIFLDVVVEQHLEILVDMFSLKHPTPGDPYFLWEAGPQSILPLGKGNDSRIIG